jgi:hypothetical protein
MITISDPTKPNYIFRHFAENRILSSKVSFFPYEVSTYADTQKKLSTVQSFIDQQSANQKRTVLLFGHDSDYPISEFLQGSPIVFRYSMSKRFKYYDEYSIPFGVRIFKESVQQVSALPWSNRPKVSFMGWVTSLNPELFFYPEEEPADVNRLDSSEIFKISANFGLLLRKKALHFLANDKRIETDFKINSAFFLQHEREIQAIKFQEYLKLMRETHYVLAIRGWGNYSMRLFETLAADRIPIMVDTNQYLPFEDKINWKELGIWIPLDKFSSIAELVVQYHNTGQKIGFQERIKTISNVYNKYLSRDASLKIIQSIIESHL